MSDEHELISRARAGDEDAWQALVETYRPFMEKSIGRYVRNEDAARDCLAGLLAKLRGGALEHFDFRSRFTTWLFIVIRNQCRDFYRGTNGVRHLLTALEGLGDAERRYFTLYYIQGLTVRETLESLRAELGPDLSYLRLSEYDERVRGVVAAKSLGTVLDRLLRPDPFFPGDANDEAADEGERREIPDSRIDDPGAAVDAGRLDEALEHLRHAIGELPPRDRLVLQLRFVHGRNAREIGELLGFSNEKQVYHRIETLLRRLRSALLGYRMSEQAYRELVRDLEELSLRRDSRGADGIAAPSIVAKTFRGDRNRGAAGRLTMKEGDTGAKPRNPESR